MAHCAAYWRETAQRAFLGATGQVGVCSLFGTPENHMVFAEHLCRKRLVQKITTDQGDRWEWAKKPGEDDWLDAYVGTWVCASMLGLRTGGEPVVRKRTRKKRKRRYSSMDL